MTSAPMLPAVSAQCDRCELAYRWRADPRGPRRLALARCAACSMPLRRARWGVPGRTPSAIPPTFETED